MTLSIKQSLQTALIADKQGDWDKSHQIVAAISHPLAYEIHAYLHRKEGDNSNANYWYARANIAPFTDTLTSEHHQLETKVSQLT